MRKFLVITSLVLPLGIALGAPVQNVSAQRHPNLAAAQSFIAQAYDKLATAQVANDYKMGGHSDKAKQLLVEAAEEIKAAAEAANQNH
jgi:hypothetical protein